MINCGHCHGQHEKALEVKECSINYQSFGSGIIRYEVAVARLSAIPYGDPHSPERHEYIIQQRKVSEAYTAMTTEERRIMQKREDELEVELLMAAPKKRSSFRRPTTTVKKGGATERQVQYILDLMEKIARYRNYPFDRGLMRLEVEGYTKGAAHQVLNVLEEQVQEAKCWADSYRQRVMTREELEEMGILG